MERDFTKEEAIFKKSHNGLDTYAYAKKMGKEWCKRQLEIFAKKDREDYDRKYPPNSMERYVHEWVGGKLEDCLLFGSPKPIGEPDYFMNYSYEVVGRITEGKPYEYSKEAK